jgi:hypothetical protein
MYLSKLTFTDYIGGKDILILLVEQRDYKTRERKGDVIYIIMATLMMTFCSVLPL